MLFLEQQEGNYSAIDRLAAPPGTNRSRAALVVWDAVPCCVWNVHCSPSKATTLALAAAALSVNLQHTKHHMSDSKPHSCVRDNNTHNHFHCCSCRRAPQLQQLNAHLQQRLLLRKPSAAAVLTHTPTAATSSSICILLQTQPMLTSRCWHPHPP